MLLFGRALFWAEAVEALHLRRNPGAGLPTKKISRRQTPRDASRRQAPGRLEVLTEAVEFRHFSD